MMILSPSFHYVPVYNSMLHVKYVATHLAKHTNQQVILQQNTQKHSKLREPRIQEKPVIFLKDTGWGVTFAPTIILLV